MANQQEELLNELELKFTDAQYQWIRDKKKAAQLQLLSQLEEALPAKLNYDSAVALREGSYTRGREKEVQGWNKYEQQVRTILATKRGEISNG
jgi:hypothetical protein